MRDGFLPVKTGIVNRKKPDICGTGNRECSRKSIHGAPDSPGSGAAGKQHQTGSSDKSRFFVETCLGDRQVFLPAGIIMPVNIHMIWGDWYLRHKDSFLIVPIGLDK